MNVVQNRRIRNSGKAMLQRKEQTTDAGRVVELVASIGSGIVLLDGCYGSGKTTLGRCICCRLSPETVTLVEADCYLKKRQDRYINALRLGRLREAIAWACHRTPIVLLDGLCAREIAEKTNVSPALAIYVQRNTQVGLAGDLSILDAESGCGDDADMGSAR